MFVQNRAAMCTGVLLDPATDADGPLNSGRHRFHKHVTALLLQAQRETAIRTGNFLDLTREADVTDEAMDAIRQEVEANDNEEAAARHAARAQERAQARAAELVHFPRKA